MYSDNVRGKQKQTIVRPLSIFTESSLSLPTNYYEQTTPYAAFLSSKYKKYQIEDDFNITFDDDDDDVVRLSDDDVNLSDDDGVPSVYDDFDDDFGKPSELIEAFNPNVKVYNENSRIRVSF